MPYSPPHAHLQKRPFPVARSLSLEERALARAQQIPSLEQLLAEAGRHNVSVMFDLRPEEDPGYERLVNITVETILGAGIAPELVSAALPPETALLGQGLLLSHSAWVTCRCPRGAAPLKGHSEDGCQAKQEGGAEVGHDGRRVDKVEDCLDKGRSPWQPPPVSPDLVAARGVSGAGEAEGAPVPAGLRAEEAPQRDGRTAAREPPLPEPEQCRNPVRQRNASPGPLKDNPHSPWNLAAPACLGLASSLGCASRL